jgi:hypothetical protein
MISPTQLCQPATFHLTIPGIHILDLTASLVTNYSRNVPSAYRYTQPSTVIQDAEFCNITVTYSHSDTRDTVNAEAWLPSHWNERFQAVGGGGWVAGRFFLSYAAMAGAIGDGYATITTDGGLGDASDPISWALMSPGQVDFSKLEDLGSISLYEQVGPSNVAEYSWTRY